MKIIAALTVPVLAVGFGALTAAPASAHTPNISATCSGVHIGATAYDANMANRWSVTIDGVTQNGTFGDSLDQTFPVPQDGATTTWSAFVEAADGSYHGGNNGQVGPCGTPPPTDVCADLPGSQPDGTACTPPPDTKRSDSKEAHGCDVTLAGTPYGAGDLTYDEEFTDTYVFNDQTNTWDLVTDTTPTIADIVFTPWTVQQQVDQGCAELPTQPPAEQSQYSSTELDCDDDVMVTTTVTTTTPYVYDAASNTWVPGHPVKQTSTDEEPVQPGDCPEVQAAESHSSGSAQAQAASASGTNHSPVPTVVDAGLAGAAPAPALATASAGSAHDSQGPALLLLMAGALLTVGAFRFRRS